jgi:hypothetical protein
MKKMVVGPWGHGRYKGPSPTQGGSLLGKGSVEIGDLIVSCGHKVGGCVELRIDLYGEID